MFSLCNVVWYDGRDAFVSKFILETQLVAIGELEPTKEAKEKVQDEIEGNGEILKIDVIRELSLQDVLDVCEQIPQVKQRFDYMYFSQEV